MQNSYPKTTFFTCVLCPNITPSDMKPNINLEQEKPVYINMETENLLCHLQLINPEVEIAMVENTPDDPRQRKPIITKAKELLGWEPTVKLRDGLPLMEDDFRTRLGVPQKK